MIRDQKVREAKKKLRKYAAELCKELYPIAVEIIVFDAYENYTEWVRCKDVLYYSKGRKA